MTWFLIALVGVALVVAWFWSMMPDSHTGVTKDLIVSWLKEVESAGGRGSAVYIKAHGGSVSVQLEVHGPMGYRSFQLAYPLAEWSAPYVENVRCRAIGRGLGMSSILAGQMRRSDIMVVHFGRDAEAAADFGIEILADVYGAPLAECVVVKLKFPLDAKGE